MFSEQELRGVLEDQVLDHFEFLHHLEHIANIDIRHQLLITFTVIELLSFRVGTFFGRLLVAVCINEFKTSLMISKEENIKGYLD